MATTIRIGATVHAGTYAENGDTIGSTCQYKGAVTSMANAKEWHGFDSYTLEVQGVARTFRRTAVHHERDCPRSKG
jgi:hypothetical protein